MNSYFGSYRKTSHSDQVKILRLSLAFSLLMLFGMSVFIVLTFDSSTASTERPIESSSIINNTDFVEVLVPRQGIKVGQKLTPSMFRFERRPTLGLPERIVRSLEEVKGQYAKSFIAAELPLVTDYLSRTAPHNPISAQIPIDYRAVTIRVDEESVVGGWAGPGSLVDVLWITNRRGQGMVHVIVETAKVLSADRGYDPESHLTSSTQAKVPATITLLVSSRDAQRVALARNTGSLTLSLRGDTDITTVGERRMQESDLFPKTPADKTKAEGSITIGGEFYQLQNGKLVPAEKHE